MNIIERIFLPSRSFRNNQLLVIMTAFFLVLATTLLSFLTYNYISIKQESSERLGALCDIIGADVEAALEFGDQKSISKSLTALRADPSIKQLFFLKDNGEISAYYNKRIAVVPDDLQQRLRNLQAEVTPSFIELSPRFERSVIRNGIRLGTIIIEQDEHLIINKMTATVVICVFIMLLALELSYQLAGNFHRVITEQVDTMSTIMQEVSYTKDYSKRVPASNTDELDKLVMSFNVMLSEIERRDVDIVERQEQLNHLANFDTLTNLPNRTLFNDRLEQALCRASRDGERLAVLFIDLDNFKIINDIHGHRTGDQLLQETAARLAVDTRAGDTLARLGGDEFTVFLQDVKTAENALAVARKHIKCLSQNYHIDDKCLYITASIGVALFPEHGTTAETLVKNADSAMYLAKEKGKRNAEIFTDSLLLKFSERSGLCNDLRRALDQEEFELYYQPRINLAQNTWTSAEALIRWNHPELGMIYPDKFIPLAEQTGLILPIGEWVIREACRQLHQWHCQGFNLPRISVNVSSLQLQKQDLFGIVKNTITSNDLSTQALELEIVESALIDDLGQSIVILKELQNIGVRISIDDFGTGYSSLRYLRSLPVDILKIDRSFLLHVHESKKDEQFLAAIIRMSQSLGLVVVTEGVENAEQEQILKNHNCQEAQGYYFAIPLPADELLQLFMTTQIHL